MNIIIIGLIFPGVSALVSTSIKHKESKNEIGFKVLEKFIDGYKKNFKDTVKFSFFYAAIIFSVLFNIVFYDGEIPIFVTVSLSILIALSTLIVTYMTLIGAKFKFRTRDLFRLSFYYIIMRFKITIGVLGIYLLAFWAFSSIAGFGLFLLVSPLIYIITIYSYPILEDVYANFVETGEETGSSDKVKEIEDE